MHILIAPNAFKNSLSAADVAQAIQLGIEKSTLRCTTECFPVADGGDGTASLIIQQRSGETVSVNVKDPLGRHINASYGLIDNGQTAVIEMADAAGLRLLDLSELNPLRTTSFGAGEMIKHAVTRGVSKIIIGMGGSATVDGGTGILQALGVQFLNSNGHRLEGLPENLVELCALDLTGLDPGLQHVEIIVLCDVTNPLLGSNGAARIFGPQKGASEKEVIRLEQALTQFNKVVGAETGIDMQTLKCGGTAGGAAAGLFAILNAKIVNGIEYFLELNLFEKSLSESDIVITGEGSIDMQTLDGKGPYGVAVKAKQKGLRVIGVAGMVPTKIHTQIEKYFDVLLAIGNKPTSLQEALLSTTENLQRTGHLIGNILNFQIPKK